MNIKKIILSTFLVAAVSFSAGIAFADHVPGHQSGTVIADPGANGTSIIDTGDNTSGNFDKLQNPLAGNGIDSIPKLVRAILDIVLTIAVPIIAIAIIYTGFLFIKAQGKPEELKIAKQTLLYVLIGAAILLAAYVIAEAIAGTITAITG